MLNNNHKNPVCADGEPLISYIYGEIGIAEKAEFEAHLKTCAACQFELKEFGFARSAVQEWRVEEFDKLATPVFEIPSNTVEIQTATTSSRPWFAGWRQIFAFKPALAMSAFAVAVLIFGVTFFIFDNPKGENELARKDGNLNLNKTIASPTVEKVVEPINPAVDAPEKNIAQVPAKVSDKKSVAVKTPAIKTSANDSKSNSGDIMPVRVVQNSSQGNQKSTGAPKSTVPRLTDADEEEDNSVRLADLFDEIGTR